MCSYGPLRANSVARLRTSGAVLHGHRVVSLGAVNLREMVDSVPVWYHEFEFAHGLVRFASSYDQGAFSSIGRWPLACSGAFAVKTPPTGALAEMR